MILFKEVKKIFLKNKQKIVALDGVDLRIKEGEAVVIKGRSGSGKSTLLSLMAALSKPTSGEIIISGEHIAKFSDEFASKFRQKHIGFIFQKYNLLEQLSVYENIITPLIPLNPNKQELEKKVHDVLVELSLLDKKEIPIKVLSGGEQQRVAIARSIINEPTILLADEPTANLDETLSKEFIEMLRKLKKKNQTLVIATHDPLFFELDFIDRVIEMKKGKLCF